ncbi:MAG: NADH-quinone oxidoreductase subunit J [Betaproteobacteria bacterium]|jgi:NADH-quinone oxidoreductase subunit J|nr:NADH-quinone oxidoreductase subunit J [Betaproteobacteria bacterium]
MDNQAALFYVFSAVLLFAALRVITARSTVHAALFLVLAFFSASCVWMLLQAEFLAITLVLVYVGAVMVLFLFVVMMLDINTDQFRQNFWQHLPLAGLIGAVIAVEMALVLMSGFRVSQAAPVDPRLAEYGNTRLLGIELYTHYLYPLQLAAVLLLVAMVAALALTLRKRKDVRAMDPGQQVRVKRADRVRMVSMPAEVEASAASAEPAEGGAAPGAQAPGAAPGSAGKGAA